MLGVGVGERGLGPTPQLQLHQLTMSWVPVPFWGARRECYRFGPIAFPQSILCSIGNVPWPGLCSTLLLHAGTKSRVPRASRER